jgi:hypothetical protein
MITCNNLAVYCRDVSDNVVLRIVAAGEILMHTVNCADMVAPGFDYAQKEFNLSGNESEYNDYESGLSSLWSYEI